MGKTRLKKQENFRYIKKKSAFENNTAFRWLKRSISRHYNRRKTTAWSEKENAALRQVASRPDALKELKQILKLYNSSYEYARRDIQTLLNNWTVELDRAAHKIKPRRARLVL